MGLDGPAVAEFVACITGSARCTQEATTGKRTKVGGARASASTGGATDTHVPDTTVPRAAARGAAAGKRATVGAARAPASIGGAVDTYMPDATVPRTVSFPAVVYDGNVVFRAALATGKDMRLTRAAFLGKIKKLVVGSSHAAQHIGLVFDDATCLPRARKGPIRVDGGDDEDEFFEDPLARDNRQAYGIRECASNESLRVHLYRMVALAVASAVADMAGGRTLLVSGLHVPPSAFAALTTYDVSDGDMARAYVPGMILQLTTSDSASRRIAVSVAHNDALLNAGEGDGGVFEMADLLRARYMADAKARMLLYTHDSDCLCIGAWRYHAQPLPPDTLFTRYGNGTDRYLDIGVFFAHAATAGFRGARVADMMLLLALAPTDYAKGRPFHGTTMRTWYEAYAHLAKASAKTTDANQPLLLTLGDDGRVSFASGTRSLATAIMARRAYPADYHTEMHDVLWQVAYWMGMCERERLQELLAVPSVESEDAARGAYVRPI